MVKPSPKILASEEEAITTTTHHLTSMCPFCTTSLNRTKIKDANRPQDLDKYANSSILQVSYCCSINIHASEVNLRFELELPRPHQRWFAPYQ